MDQRKRRRVRRTESAQTEERERDVMAARRELQLWKQDVCLMMFCINRACVFMLCKPRRAAVISCTLIIPTPMIDKRLRLLFRLQQWRKGTTHAHL